MALIVQKPGFTINGEERDPGFVIPKEVEIEGSWAGPLRRGSVIALPDSMLDDSSIQLSENGTDVDLSQSLEHVKEAVKHVDSKEKLEELNVREAKGKDRKYVYKLLDKRRREIE